MPNTLLDHSRCTDLSQWSHAVESIATPYSTVINVVDIMVDITAVAVMTVQAVVAAAVQVAVVAVVQAVAKLI